MKHFFTLSFLFAVLLSACSTSDKSTADTNSQATTTPENPGPTPVTEPETVNPVNVQQSGPRTIKVSDVVVPQGLQVEVVSLGHTYPVDIAFDQQGNTYIAEAGGHTYGTKPKEAPDARILQLMPDGSSKVIYDKLVPLEEIRKVEFPTTGKKLPEGLIPPVTGITHYEGKLYISHRSRYSVLDPATGEFKTIIDGLPSWGEFLNAKPIFKDGKMYFFLSTQGNSGLPEKHWVKVMDIFNKTTAHEIPGEDVVLTGLNYWVPTQKLANTKVDSILTGVYVPLGVVTKPGQVIKGQEICNGAFFRCNPDGTNIERIAWGLRSSFGYRFSPDGRLITTMNSANPMPPRGLYFDYEPVYEIKEGEWYGWPDFYSGIPITDERFEFKDEVRRFALTPETHKKLLKGKERPLQPVAKLPVHSAAQGMVFGRQEFGVPANDILVAEFGTIIPFFKGNTFHPKLPKGVPTEDEAPEGVEYNWPGFKVQQVNLQTGEATDYVYNRTNLPASATENAGGLERPIQLEWGPDGSLYIVDFGIVEFHDKGMNAHPKTGVIWKVRKTN